MLSEENKPLNIKKWNPEDRPREKMLLKGRNTLSEAELIAILIGSGTASMSAVEVSKKILALSNQNLNELAKLSIKELMKVKGIGEAKAITIAAALELGRRRKEEFIEKKPRITTSQEAFNLLTAELSDLLHEEFWVLLLNRANFLIKKHKISEGGVSGTVVDPKIIYKIALENLASNIVVVHNHPSGNLSPSKADIELTQKLKQAGTLLDIQLLDHLIIANHQYISFADKGIL